MAVKRKQACTFIKKTLKKQADPILRLRNNIDKAFGAKKYLNPCVIKRCPAKHGYGAFARRDLKKNTPVAYYVIKLVKNFTHKSPTKFVYLTTAPSSPSRPNSTSRTFEGDIGQDTGDVFGRYIFRERPVCGHVFNEPSEHQTQNCDMVRFVWDAGLLKESDGKSRTTFKAGDVVFHEIRTLRAVKKGEELMTMYGDDYERKYKVGKKFKKVS